MSHEDLHITMPEILPISEIVETAAPPIMLTVTWTEETMVEDTLDPHDEDGAQNTVKVAAVAAAAVKARRTRERPAEADQARKS